MILSGKDIVKYGIVSNVEETAIQPNSIDLKLTGVYYPVTKELGKKLSEEDFIEVECAGSTEVIVGDDIESGWYMYDLDYDTKYLFGVPKIDLRPKLKPLDLSYDDPMRGLHYFTAEIKPKSSWSIRGFEMYGNVFDTGFCNTGFILVRTPQYRDGMPKKLTVNTDMYFAQLKVSDAYPTENYVRVMGR